jgi:transposase
VLALEKRKARGQRMNDKKRGYVIAVVQLLRAEGKPVNFAAIGRLPEVRASRVTVYNIVRAHIQGQELPPTQPHIVQTHRWEQKRQKIAKRREMTERVALKRTRADDNTPRPMYPTLRDIRQALPLSSQPRSLTTVRTDLRAQGVWRLATVPCPVLGKKWEKERLAYAKRALATIPVSTNLICSDECLFTLYNTSCLKEYRKLGTKPMVRRKVAYPEKVMVWAAIGKTHRSIVVHTGSEPREFTGDWKTRSEMVAKTRMKLKHISPTARYTKAALEAMSAAAQREWLNFEHKFVYSKAAKGVTKIDHCKKCLLPLSIAMKGQQCLVLEDNASIHSSNYTHIYKRYLKLKFVEDHPPHSCDMNPCEFVWSVLKEKVSFRGPPTAKDLAQCIEKEFAAIPQATMDKWIDTYWSRLSSCVAEKGAWVGNRECRMPRHVRM